MGVSVWVGFEGVNDALLEDDCVSLAFFFLFGVAVLFGLVRIMHGDGSLLLERLGDFVDNVGFEKIKVQLNELLCAC